MINENTATKLQELSKRRAAFATAKAAALSSAEAQGTDEIQRLSVLNQGVKACFAVRDRMLGRNPLLPSNIEILARNLDRFVAQASSDPSIWSTMLAEWEQRLRRPLDEQSLKYEYASLCTQLIDEWLSGETPSGEYGGDVEMKEGGFKKVDKADKLQARVDCEESIRAGNCQHFQA